LLDTCNDTPVNLGNKLDQAIDWMKGFKILHIFCLTEDNPTRRLWS